MALRLDENRERVWRNLCITLANCWAKKENGVKTDKLTLMAVSSSQRSSSKN